jgi:hypothetical protein
MHVVRLLGLLLALASCRPHSPLPPPVDAGAVVTHHRLGAALSGGFFPSAVSGTVKTTGGQLYCYRAENRNASARWLQLWDTPSGAPGSGTLLDSIWIPGSSAVVIDHLFFGPNGADFLPFTTGLTFGFSTTISTYTAATAADHTLFVCTS